MERLTRKEKDGTILIERHTEVQDCLSNYMLPSDIAAVHRLAAYEDTGLEPEEVKAMAENVETRLLTWCEARYGMTVGQLMDLGKAEQEGRLVVLPCKVGDTVYRIFAPDGREPVISAHTLMSADYIVRWIDKFGKTVFLTREEAERALEANKNIGDKNKKPTE